MKFRLIVYALTIALAHLVTPVAVHAQQETRLNAVYATEGTNSKSKKPYRAVLETKPINDTTYMLKWTTAKLPGGEYAEAYGYGFIDNGRLVALSVDVDSGYPTVCLYDLRNGKWEGLWSAVNSGELGTETLIPTDKSAEFLREILPAPGQIEL